MPFSQTEGYFENLLEKPRAFLRETYIFLGPLRQGPFCDKTKTNLNSP